MPSEDALEISRIEIEFAIPVALEDADIRKLDVFVQRIAKRNQPEGMVHWCSGMGNKPLWSQTDAQLLGKQAAPDALVTGEPTWDNTVLHFETTCRERYPGETD